MYIGFCSREYGWKERKLMNKKDIAAMRRQFKLDNDLLTISNIYNVYIREESSDVYYEEIQPFEMIEREQQEMFMANFKKVLTGKMDQKIFEVKFERPAEEDPDHTQQLLYEGLETTDLEEWKEKDRKSTRLNSSHVS